MCRAYRENEGIERAPNLVRLRDIPKTCLSNSMLFTFAAYVRKRIRGIVERDQGDALVAAQGSWTVEVASPRNSLGRRHCLGVPAPGPRLRAGLQRRGHAKRRAEPSRIIHGEQQRHRRQRPESRRAHDRDASGHHHPHSLLQTCRKQRDAHRSRVGGKRLDDRNRGLHRRDRIRLAGGDPQLTRGHRIRCRVHGRVLHLSRALPARKLRCADRLAVLGRERCL